MCNALLCDTIFFLIGVIPMKRLLIYEEKENLNQLPLEAPNREVKLHNKSNCFNFAVVSTFVRGRSVQKKIFGPRGRAGLFAGNDNATDHVYMKF